MTEFLAVLLTLGVILLLVGLVGKVKIFPYLTSDGYRVDWCYDSAKGCGQTSANEFCRRQGLVQAVDFTQDPNVGRDGIVTKMLGTGELCENPVCDAFKSITCQ